MTHCRCCTDCYHELRMRCFTYLGPSDGDLLTHDSDWLHQHLVYADGSSATRRRNDYLQLRISNNCYCLQTDNSDWLNQHLVIAHQSSAARRYTDDNGDWINGHLVFADRCDAARRRLQNDSQMPCPTQGDEPKSGRPLSH
ncbi:hypothetical protein SprV_0902729900 [Sparganum proliferum]